MPYFAVTREAGPGWTDGLVVSEQPGVGDHATFMKALAAEGVVVLGGPLAGSEQGRTRALFLMSAPTESDLRRRLADDPWERDGRFISAIEPWGIFLGEDRLSAGGMT
jgi:uncharacterized protein YciI